MDSASPISHGLENSRPCSSIRVSNGSFKYAGGRDEKNCVCESIVRNYDSLSLIQLSFLHDDAGNWVTDSLPKHLRTAVQVPLAQVHA
jgi:hypothetical protein